MSSASLYALAVQSMLGKRMDVIANNVANASTPAYKREELLFGDYMAKVGTSKTAPSNDVRRNYRDGKLEYTNGSLDVALRGEGFFQIKTPDGLMYTRNGHFSMDSEGNLITGDGHKVLADNGQPIVVPLTSDEVTISPEGNVFADGGQIATFGLYQFEEADRLERAGAGLFIARDQVPLRAEDLELIQGAIEGSNVVPIVEITRMMTVMRSYQSAAKLSESEHERLRRAIQALTEVQ